MIHMHRDAILAYAQVRRSSVDSHGLLAAAYAHVPRAAGRSRIVVCIFAAALLCWLAASLPAAAQVPLSAVNNDTEVRNISFKFVDGNDFDEKILEEQIWHRDPGFWDKVMKVLPFISMPEFPFSPIELQKDVVRLRSYYQRNGFLHPTIDYPASQVDTSSNRIHIIFSIRRGPPLIIQDVGFYGTGEEYAAELFRPAVREKWIDFRDEVTLETGSRYTEFEGIRLRDQVQSWLKNAGFAFASVRREADVDSSANTVDLRFTVDPGPRGYVSEIQIEGNESVSRNVVIRELPFSVGDRFSAEKLTQGQQELFALGLFRAAISDVPEQPRDSSVVVRYRLREARPRFTTAQTGYALEEGANVQGEWKHRNFLGGARTLTVSGAASSGIGGRRAGGFRPTQQYRGSVSLQQPYLFSRKLSGIFTPFYEWQDNPAQRIQFQEAGLRTSVIYTVYTYRTVTFQHSLVRSQPLSGGTFTVAELPNTEFVLGEDLDIYNRNIFTLSANLGRVDDFLNPTRGFLVRPLLESGGQLITMKEDVNYFKTRLEAIGFMPLTRGYDLTGRIYAGRIWPTGDSRNQEPGTQTEFRFDRIRFYAGGASDVRGWPINLLGQKFAFREVITSAEGDTLDIDYDFEPNGGLAKLAANLEVLTPFPFFSSAWRGALFVDVGQVYPTAKTDSLLRAKERESKVDFSLKDLRIGIGGGLRYETMVGFIRFDLGYKVNPTLEDLASPKEVWLLEDKQIQRSEIETSVWDRFRLHLSIGQTF